MVRVNQGFAGEHYNLPIELYGLVFCWSFIPDITFSLVVQVYCKNNRPINNWPYEHETLC